MCLRAGIVIGMYGGLAEELLLNGEGLLSFGDGVFELGDQFAVPGAYSVVVGFCIIQHACGVEAMVSGEGSISIRGPSTFSRGCLCLVVLNVFYFVDELLKELVVLQSQFPVHEIVPVDCEHLLFMGRLRLFNLMELLGLFTIFVLIEVKIVLHIRKLGFFSISLSRTELFLLVY